MSSIASTPDRARAEQAQGGDYDLTLFGDNHVQAYEESNGDVGYIWNGAPILVLTTTGAKSGKVRKHALIYGTDGDDVLLIASQGGAPDNPHWYKNLDADPNVGVQILADRFKGRARTATAEEKARLWPVMTELWPAYDDYQAATDRDIPVVIIERVASAT
jgi:deazaflavin-dependent oxidoreductase (nitroreductase family)